MKMSSAVTMFVVAALLISALGIFKPVYAGVPAIYMMPSANYYYRGTPLYTLFDVTIWVRDAPLISAWQVYLEFNDDILSVTKWTEPTTCPQYIFAGKTTSANPTPPDIGYVHMSPGKGMICVAASLFPTPPAQLPSSGCGKLCIITFKIMQLPAGLPSQPSLSCALAINKACTTLLDADGNDVTLVTKTDGKYMITSGLLGDLNGNGKVDIQDVFRVAMAFGSYGPNYLYPCSPPHPRWNPACDLNNDNRVNIIDLFKVCSNYGKDP